MGLIHKIANTKLYERGANYELGQSIGNTVSSLFGTGGADIEVLREYSGFVWKCVNIRSEDLAGQNYFVTRKVGDKWQRDDNHEFNKVLEGVDGGYDLSELIEAHQVSMDMYGESFWYFSKGEFGRKPFAVYLLDPAYVSVYVSGERVTGYIYDKEGDRITMDLDEIAHFRIHNPSNRFRGAGPMQKAGWFIKSSRYITTYINNFLENNAIPAGVIVNKDAAVNDDDWKLFKQAWTEKYSGVNNSGKTGFLRGDIDFIKTGLSLGDVDFEKVKNSSRDDILAMFSVPKSKLGLYEDMNKASALTSDQQFAKSFTKSAVSRITRRLSRKVGVWYGQQYQVASDFSVPEDRELKLKEIAAGVNVWLTPNEARELYDFEGMGKEFDVIQADNPADQPNDTTKSAGKITLRLKNTTQGYSYQMKEDFRSKTEDIQRKYEQQFLQASNKVLTDQKDRVLTQITPKKLVDAHLDVDKEATQLLEATIAVELALATEQGEFAAVFAGGADAKFKLTPVTEKYISDSLHSSIKGFTQETIDKIAKILAQGVQDGSTIADISKEIGKVYDDLTGIKNPGYRIERLARTEVIKTSNEITEVAYSQSGVVRKKEWLTNPGACEFCRALNGNIINLGGTFVPLNAHLDGADGGTRMNDYEEVKHPPVHSNCRCTLIPVIEAQL